MALKSALSKSHLRVSGFAGEEVTNARPPGEKKAVSVITGNVKAFALANRLADKAKARRISDAGDQPAAPGAGNAAAAPAAESDPAKQAETSKPRPKESLLEMQKRKQEEQDRKDEEEMMNAFANVEQPEFKAAPEHVRGLCQAAKRSWHQELVKEKGRLNAARALLQQSKEKNGRRKAGRAFASVYAPVVVQQIANNWLTASELAECEYRGADRLCQRLEYIVNVLERRRDRLANIDLDDETFEQLPGQLVEAGADGDYEYVRLCSDAGVPLDVFNNRGVTPLIAATVGNKVSTARLLLERRADPAMQDMNAATCLHYAILLHRYQILDAGLEAVNKQRSWVALYSKDARGKTVVDYARMPGREESLRLLKLRLGGPPGVMLTVAGAIVHNAVNALPEGSKTKTGLAKHVAKVAAERAKEKMQEKLMAARERAREKLYGGWLCSYCSKVQISEKKLDETIDTHVSDEDWKNYLEEMATNDAAENPSGP
eukprot:TRINITY_DN87350_c0_g1_i1.p1 TRINITY_DN87350_c0_g1~~TRINITY_DN87350_c0_g1_i1.p1  ORF type:complete len:489 (+),score=118.48 TRINITY_DN87350_c0_g1_i1:141-1607(+)